MQADPGTAMWEKAGTSTLSARPRRGNRCASALAARAVIVYYVLLVLFSPSVANAGRDFGNRQILQAPASESQQLMNLIPAMQGILADPHGAGAIFINWLIRLPGVYLLVKLERINIAAFC